MRALCLLAVVIATVGVGCGDEDGSVAPPTEAPAWNHDPADASVGPNAWSDLEGFEECGSGREQSPVDVTAAVDTGLPSLELDYPATPVVVENTGHTVEAVMPETGGPTMTIAGVEYRLLQYHFHAPSEHTLEGTSFAAEVHLVHESDEGELAVVGVFTYRGSLPTPGCGEGVRWIVSPEPGRISSDALSRLHELIADFPEYDGYENNNRPTQPLNGRTIERANGG